MNEETKKSMLDQIRQLSDNLLKFRDASETTEHLDFLAKMRDCFDKILRGLIEYCTQIEGYHLYKKIGKNEYNKRIKDVRKQIYYMDMEDINAHNIGQSIVDNLPNDYKLGERELITLDLMKSNIDILYKEIKKLKPLKYCDHKDNKGVLALEHYVEDYYKCNICGDIFKIYKVNDILDELIDPNKHP